MELPGRGKSPRDFQRNEGLGSVRPGARAAAPNMPPEPPGTALPAPAGAGPAARRTSEGLFGLNGIERAVRETGSRSATATARAIQEAVLRATAADEAAI